MKNYEKVIAEIVRIEETKDGKMFMVFEVKDPKMKVQIKNNWFEDIEYKLDGKNLVK